MSLVGDTPVPRRMVITYKQVDHNPRYRLQMAEWEFEDIADDTFKLEMPRNALRVKVTPAGAQGS